MEEFLTFVRIITTAYEESNNHRDGILQSSHLGKEHQSRSICCGHGGPVGARSGFSALERPEESRREALPGGAVAAGPAGPVMTGIYGEYGFHDERAPLV